MQNSVSSLQLELDHIRSWSEDSLLQQARKEVLEGKLEVHARACQYCSLGSHHQTLPAKQRAYQNVQDLMRALDVSADQLSNLPLLLYKSNPSCLPTEVLLDSQKTFKELRFAST